MATPEHGYGQATDLLKLRLIQPPLCEQIVQTTARLGRPLAIADIGTGTGENLLHLLRRLQAAGRPASSVSIVERDRHVAQPLLQILEQGPFPPQRSSVFLSNDWQVLPQFLERESGMYDVALIQLVLHQIENAAEANLLNYLAYVLLSEQGTLYTVHLHPKYLAYLAQNEPDKFASAKFTDMLTTGRYHFAAGESIEIYSRSAAVQAASLVGLGLTVEYTPLFTDRVAALKPRYARMAEQEVPLFYLLRCQKNHAASSGQLRGIVSELSVYNAQRLQVRFTDGKEFLMPQFPDWNTVTPGDFLLCKETLLAPLQGTVWNYWCVRDRLITGGSLLVKKQSG